MIEQERKFLLLSMPKTDSTIKIKQGYLMFDDNKHLRVRIIDDRKAYLTFKTIHTSKVRTEYEYEIPLSDAIQMLNNCNCRLEKIRHKTSFEGSIVDIDIYPNGLSVVEIEYENELDKLPDYCGQEITGMPEYSNVNIAYQQSS
jgi:CYTH domain-containing protein